MTDVLALDIAKGPLYSTVVVPGSKSVANRALICALLAHGGSVVRNVATGDDTAAMLDCIRALGAKVDVNGSTWRIEGVGGRPRAGEPLNARLAGTTSRFITAAAALGDTEVIIDGDEPLRRRPMAPLHEALSVLGATVRAVDEHGHLPVAVARGTMSGGRVSLRGDVSSQYVSALMLIAPCLKNGIEIGLTTKLISRPYVAITASVMSAFGAGGVAVGDNLVAVESGGYSGTDYEIEPDASSASYPLAAAAIAGGTVTVAGLSEFALQGDAAFASILGEMGCRIDYSRGTTVVGGHLRGIDIDMADISDLVPTIAVVAAFAASPTRISGVGFIRKKESDRIGELVRGLRMVGVDALEEEDGLVVRPNGDLHGATLPSHDDHRLAMAWSLLALRVPGISVVDPEVVSKSWPDWWSVRSTLLAEANR